MEKYIAIAANIGTFISSILVLLTLIEMKAQRKAQVTPELVLDINKFCIIDGKHYQYQNNILSEKDDILSISIINIGLSAAKNIEIEFKYDIKFFSEVLNCKEITVEINRDNHLIIDSPIISSNIYINYDNKKTLPYVEKFTNVSVKENISLPENYSNLLVVYNELPQYENDKCYQKQIPPLYINVKYSDLLNNEYKNKYVLNVFFSGIENYQNSRFVGKYGCVIERYKFSLLKFLFTLFNKLRKYHNI